MEGSQAGEGTVLGPKAPEQVKPASFIATGGDVEHIKVEISYGIIQRFSEGLYSSPNKAFEELVSNSYDAGATCVWIEMPEELEDASSILVLDNGESMDLAGLHELWQIGKSSKRTGGEDGGEKVVNGRHPIGKFGIGKLATYVLADELTYICRTGGEYLAVTMDYSLVSGDTELSATQPLELEVVSLDASEAQEAVTSEISDFASKKLAAFFEDEPENWTAVVLTKIKGKGASEIQQGMLKWVLRTALPVNPQFNLYFRGAPLTPSKFDGERSWEWTVGKNDKGESAPSNWKYKEFASLDDDEVPYLDLPHAGHVTGKAELFVNSLQRGKSEEWGRSHGFFVKVRNRLINLEDAEFGVGVELRHGTFTRFRMEIDADGLDDFVASPRESIQESPARKELRQYLLDVFNRARAKSIEIEEEADSDSLAAADRIADAPAALSQKPLRRLLEHAVEKRDPELLQLFSMDEDEDVESAREVLASNDNLLGSVEIDDLPDPHRLVGYDPSRRAIVVNSTHPFVRNYLGAKGATDVVRDIGAAELLTEAYLLDQDFPSSFIKRFLDRRDALLRALTKVGPRATPVIAEQLRDSKHSEKELEDAAADALQHLGYEVQRIGGNGKPDGIATARLGRLTKDEVGPSYSLTYDTKSTRSVEKDAIQAGAARTNILKVHRQDVDADHTLLIAPDFEGGDDPERNLGKICVNDSITPIRVADFARLVELIPFRNITPRTLRDLFSLHLPKDTKDFVDTLEATPPDPRPVREVLEIIADYGTKQDAVAVEAINAALNERVKKDFGVEEVEAIVRGLRALAPRTVYFENSVVALNASPEAVLSEIQDTLEPLSPDLVGSYKRELEGTAE